MGNNVVVRIDNTGTPSVIGPFETVEECIAFANDLRAKWDGDKAGKVKIAELKPIPDSWKWEPSTEIRDKWAALKNAGYSDEDIHRLFELSQKDSLK